MYKNFSEEYLVNRIREACIVKDSVTVKKCVDEFHRRYPENLRKAKPVPGVMETVEQFGAQVVWLKISDLTYYDLTKVEYRKTILCLINQTLKPKSKKTSSTSLKVADGTSK